MKNYGLKIGPKDEKAYIFGVSKIPSIILQSDGQWDEFLPAFEPQARGNLETQCCPAYGTDHAIATIMKRLFNGDYNFSERFVAVVSGMSGEGGDPHVIAETIRKNGLISESELPFDSSVNTLEKYFAPRPMIEPYISDGLKWLNQYEFLHEYVGTPGLPISSGMLKEALKHSPLGIAVFAWEQNADGKYIRGGEDCHWVTMYGYNEAGDWKIFDSYDSSHKLLVSDFGFSYAKRYFLKKKVSNEDVNRILVESPGIWSWIISFIKKLWHG